ncbi:beta-propeller domain-containing protein [Candidatus Uhrbacteria bacterium]|nr:beta-propeller domain-containing protein [Candidatus Uhrbacteria bacterium]
MKSIELKIAILASGLLVVIGIAIGAFFIFSRGEKPQIGNEEPPTARQMTMQEKLAAQKEIKKFATYEQMAVFLEKTAQESSGDSYSYRTLGALNALEASPAPTALGPQAEFFAGTSAKTGDGTAASAPDYSRTNIQVAGVDEADIIKTDGNYIYALVRDKLHIIKSFPAAENKIVGSIDFTSRPQELFINGDRLAVFGVDSEFQNTELYRSFPRRSDYTYLSIYDITDRVAPKELRTLRYEGNYFSSRMIGSYVYLVTHTYQYGYTSDDPMPLPRVIENNAALPNTCTEGSACFAPDAYYFDIPYESYTLATLSSVNIADTESSVEGDVYVLPDAKNMYVSSGAAYITYTKRLDEYELMMEVARELMDPRLTEKERQQIAAIETAEDFILSRIEKMEKIGRVFERAVVKLSEEEQKNLARQGEDALKQKYAALRDELEKTVIHKIAIHENRIEYGATGEVKGSVLNQFSMDENGEHFRIATTKGREWPLFSDEGEQESYSNLYVLDAAMNVIGSLEHLAQGERIYSARFMQNRAYLVTFQQTDPLFVIDLTEPTAPRVLGELKIPGFSDYLHPYDDATLIGLGKDTEATEFGGVRQKGLKLSLFDVSNVSEPSEIDTLIIGESGSDSIATHDHKAFLFSREKNLLVIPASLMETKDRGWPEFSFGGALVFYIDKNGFKLRGKIDHSDEGAGSERDWWSGYGYFDNTVRRSLYIDNALYTFSNSYLKTHSLDDLHEISSIPFERNKIQSELPEPISPIEPPRIRTREEIQW